MTLSSNAVTYSGISITGAGAAAACTAACGGGTGVGSDDVCAAIAGAVGGWGAPAGPNAARSSNLEVAASSLHRTLLSETRKAIWRDADTSL